MKLFYLVVYLKLFVHSHMGILHMIILAIFKELLLMGVGKMGVVCFYMRRGAICSSFVETFHFT